jgi:hypothetical protein
VRELAAMCEVYFYCTAYQREIDTGMDIDPDTLQRSRLCLVHVPCPWCGKLHRFLLADAKLNSSAVIDAPRIFAEPQG